MSEFAMSNAKKPGLASFDLMADLLNVFLFLLSHPLYFSYFIFFSPYLLRLFSFLSPLFVTTALLVLAFLSTVSPPSLVQDRDDSLEATPGPLAITYRALIDRLRSKAGGGEEESPRFEDFEVYKIVFDVSSALEIGEDRIVAVSEEVVKETCSEASEVIDKRLIVNEERFPGEDSPAKVKQLVGVESLKWCLEEEKNEWENVSPKKVDTKAKPWTEAPKEELFTISESKARVGTKAKEDNSAKESNGCDFFTSPEWDYFDDKHSVKSSSMDGSPTSSTHGSNLGSFGSMRKEKEWRRTLACKLFEERHNAAEGSEGMDLLWETYENEASKGGGGQGSKAIKNMSKNGARKGKKGGLDCDDDDDDEDYEDETNGQLCCLQALKFSAGKVSLGMGRPNLVKFSKALKGIGWLHNVTRHGKKRYN